MHSRFVMWPGEPDSSSSSPNLKRITRIMNPKDHQGNTFTKNVERSILGSGRDGTLVEGIKSNLSLIVFS